jgi:hypothetical protein
MNINVVVPTVNSWWLARVAFWTRSELTNTPLVEPWSAITASSPRISSIA